jgi:hypothetical protein
MSRHLGLIIGVNHYQDSTFRPLQCAENDARALAQWLVNTRGGKWSPPDVQLVQGQLATKELVESLITQICLTKAEVGDVILLYFAGHAFIDERTGEGYLALTNSRYQDTNTCLSLPSFTQHVLARSSATQILCIVDSFQTGQLWNMRRTSPFDSKPLLGSVVLNLLQAQPNRLLMISCRGNDYAPEIGERGLGLLMHRMIIGLTGPVIDQSSGQVALANLHAYLFKTLGEQQRPQLYGQPQLPFILVGELPSGPPTGSGTFPNPVAAGVPPTPLFHPNMPGMPGSGAQFLPHAPFAGTGTLTPRPDTLPQSPTPTAGIPQQQKEALLNQAQQLIQANHLGEAFNLIEQVLHSAPQDTDALIIKGRLLGTAGRYNEARDIIDQLLKVDPNNAIGWSMRAVVLSNQGHDKPALEAIERSLELDAQNPETYAIKNNIMGSIALTESQSGKTKIPEKYALKDTEEIRINIGRSIARGLSLHILGIILGLAGFGLLSVNAVPGVVGLLVASLGLGLLSVNATRGAYRSGVLFIVVTLITTIAVAGTFFATYKYGFTALVTQLNTHPSMFKPFMFLSIWLVAAAIIPLLGSIGGTIAGSIKRGRT